VTVMKTSPILAASLIAYAEAVHHGFDGLGRVDFGDDHIGSVSLGAHGDAASAPAVAGDDDAKAREQQVRGANDAIECGLAGAVAIVEEVFGKRVINGDDRELEGAVLAMARRRMTPVVVSSVPPTTFLINSVRLVRSWVTRSAPSSMVMCGAWSRSRGDVRVIGGVVLGP